MRKKERKAAAEAVNEAPVITTQPVKADQTLIAVITAAIAAVLGTSSNGIVIRSLRRSRQSTPVWGAEGRKQHIYNRF